MRYVERERERKKIIISKAIVTNQIQIMRSLGFIWELSVLILQLFSKS